MKVWTWGGHLKPLIEGFTLAEVLITIGIIGIVAAMTIPTLINFYQNKIITIKLKQTYSILTQALSLAKGESGEPHCWDYANFTKLYLKPYLKVLDDSDITDGGSVIHIYCRDGVTLCDGYGGFLSSDKILLNNGVLIGVNRLDNGVTIIVDIDGKLSKNIYGKDVFMFSFDPDHGLEPYGLGMVAGGGIQDKNILYNYLLNREYRSCLQKGIFCAAIIMLDGWEISPNYKF